MRSVMVPNYCVKYNTFIWNGKSEMVYGIEHTSYVSRLFAN